MSLWAQQHLTPAELAQVATAVDPASEAILAKMPAILKETLLFPYTQGLQLTLGAFQQGGYAGVDQLFANPPDTTEQLLHADKLAAREPAVEVTFPADLAASLGDGWTVALQDTLGEYQLSVLLGDAAGATSPADAAVRLGWRPRRLDHRPRRRERGGPRHEVGHGRGRGPVRRGPLGLRRPSSRPRAAAPRC